MRDSANYREKLMNNNILNTSATHSLITINK